MYHNEKQFDKFLDDILKIKNLYVIVGGDSTDNANVHSASSIFEESCHGFDQIVQLKEKLKKIKDRILFCRSGNHGYERALKHSKLIPEQILADALDKPFIHGCGTVFFNVRKNCYVVTTWHNAKRPERMEWLRSDISFYEHLHKTNYELNLIAEPNKYSKKWMVREKLDVQSGSYLGWGGYSADKGYRPLASKTPIVELSGTDRGMTVYDSPQTIIDLQKGRLRDE